MYFNEVQQGLWHYFPSSTKVLIPQLSKPLRDICFKEDIFLLPGISRMLYFKDCCQFSLGPKRWCHSGMEEGGGTSPKGLKIIPKQPWRRATGHHRVTARPKPPRVPANRSGGVQKDLGEV